MRIGILSTSPKAFSTKRLKEAALARGHKVQILDTLKFSMFVEEESPELTYKGKDLAHYDAVIPRIGASITAFGTSVVRQFEQMGVFTVNSSNAITVSRDKLRSLQILSRHDIGIPHSAYVRNAKDIIPAIETVGGAPVIIKLLEGTQGIGVILAETVNLAEAIIQTLHSTKQNVLIQKFVAESKGKDIRAFVVGDRVVAAMRRVAQGQEYRSNVHRGGKAEKVDLDPLYEQTAVRAAQIMGLRVAGVDLLEGSDGPKVCEVNSSPGLEGIEGATGVDIAGAIIEYIEEHVLFPDIDLRQRLTLKKGYTIAEFVVGPNSSLLGTTLRKIDLKSQDIIVLSINRNSAIIPNPSPDLEILQGDSLLCFGTKLTMETLIPPKKPKPKRKKKIDSAKS